MDGAQLQDRIARSMGIAARHVGVACDAYRPIDGTDPLASARRFLRLQAAFNAQDVRFRDAGLPADAVWYGVLDAAYLQAGDYLVEVAGGRSWFVGALQPLLPPICILCNAVLDVSRPGIAVGPGVNGYGGTAAAVPVLRGFPASLLHAGGGHGASALPADARPGSATALLPAVGGIAIARGDVLRDALGRGFVVGLAERNSLGWRLDLRQAAS